ncbi:CYFA0S14e02586g1_1 [Cyberlindnera fabianii]|uniref:CYFA0S14e02586g1_1 n=1 Tax=Cyberlindnera fabianii TaxID=36022 RepID=A0A061BBW6_CYBFA|nr:CYFA0S14e02586g1_1 [Cyberlindnera fabianii]
MASKIKRVRTGCWTCKKRRRKCDEGKPECNNCVKSGRTCEGYGLKLSFDVDDSRNNGKEQVNAKGQVVHGFRGRPRLKESLAKRDSQIMTPVISTDSKDSETTVDKVSKSEGKTAVDEHLASLMKDAPKINIMEEFHIFQDLFPSFLFDSEMPSFISDFNIEQPTTPKTDAEHQLNTDPTTQQLTDIEENMMLKHFFKRLLPLLDAHPSSPWPQLALKYCDFEVAKSCFIALSCIHLYQTRGAQEFFRTGMRHVNNTMEYLIDYLRAKGDEDADSLVIETIIKNLKKTSLEKQRSNSFVILLLIHVHFLFSVLESGRSALVRNFCELFAAIVKDSSFRSYLDQIDESSTVIANISWFDTIAAVVSPDCRLPYCDETWYGTKNTPKSTTRLMGCPGEIFRCINRFCHLRRDLKQTYNVIDINVEQKFNAIRFDLINYREYVVFQSDDFEYEYDKRLKCAQCWALAVLVNLYKLVRPEDTQSLNGFIDEFISVYSTMESSSPLITQMVWPVFTIGCASKSVHQRNNLKKFMDTLFEQVGMGTVDTMRSIVQECWTTGKEWEEILQGQEWLPAGIDFLVV